MSMLGQWDEEDTVPEPTDAQRDYAASLLERLWECGNSVAYDFERQIEACNHIGEMSDLIDDMKAELEEYE